MEFVILVVDDDMANLALAQKILGKEYRVAAANSGEVAFKYLENKHPNLILLDINMPQMDGFQVMEKLHSTEKFAQIPVIFLTADSNPEIETKCFAVGAVDFVAKPFLPDVLLSRVRRTLELEKYRFDLEHMVEEQTQIIMARTRRISQIQEKVIMGMATLIETRDNSTGKHVKNTKNYVKRIAEDIAMYHHERWDGTGYPIGLKGEDIPLCARIMALADVFDALYEERCYKEPIRPVYKIMQILNESKETQFDPVITEVFVSMEQQVKEMLGELL